MADSDKIVGKDSNTSSYVNGRGEALKFTKGGMSIYSTTPDKPHAGTHIDINHSNNTFSVTTHGVRDNKSSNNNKSNTSSGNCYLTSACMQHMKENFDDNCYELLVLRWFRDNYVSLEDINHYYETAPIIVETINQEDSSELIYEEIYQRVINPCVKAIENDDYEFAYTRYKESILQLEELYVRKELELKLVKTLKAI